MTRNLEDWLLTSQERGNPATILDERHAGKAAWSTGNQVRPLVHGAVYFAELLAGVNELRAGDSLLFTDWRGDCDELLAGAGSEVAHVLCAAAGRGVVVRGLVWRSHPDRMRFSAPPVPARAVKAGPAHWRLSARRIAGPPAGSPGRGFRRHRHVPRSPARAPDGSAVDR